MAEKALPPYKPQLATLVEAAPQGDDWLHEIKLDGYRIGCLIQGRKVTLETRRNNDWTESFPTVAKAAAKLGVKSALLDGEVAALMPSGVTSFQALHDAEAAGGTLVYFVFDLLHLNGEDLTKLPLEQRKERLAELLRAAPDTQPVFRYCEHFVGDGPRVHQHACQLGTEGIVSKRRNAPYRTGRNESWQKVKCVLRQEFVISGFTDPEGARSGIGALLVGYYDDDGTLVYAGKVGTGKGFTREFLDGLRKQLDAVAQDACPFASKPKIPKVAAVHWLKPVVVGEVQFVEWTADGHLRHPSFLGVRKDKKAKDVVRERPSTD